MTDEPAARDPWQGISRHTAARIALGRSGDGLPTARLLEFQLDHARARDAVHLPFDAAAVAAAITVLPTRIVRSQAADRASYLRRPDLGRRLDDGDRAQLATAAGAFDLALVVCDGLSALAVHTSAAALIAALVPRLDGWRLAPVVLAHQGRVALGDDIALSLGARMVVVLIGERPGLSAADSLGAYLTWAPRGDSSDAERNCLSNIRPGGMPIDAAAAQLAWLLTESRRLKLSGVGLKGDVPVALADGPASPLLPG
ncbi:ethanolamine ammonia-lyase subunit EutC [Defluviicoccus vanus]|uniref:Ethanolamine ammonia-lyase small subunit n=1 Tax=Defluviicoccus vanus TaxID=111831 RepID=A0A7H1N5Y3_9PROT|nr:ethanolamine ammonia-lyase subunit EutC [Defluviicoccus vanus]QNT71119.1 ethanolamine ammonia-lyase subunit EutC [Defluviicoccus vanus]